MTEPASEPSKPAQSQRRFWLTVGEVVAVAGLLLAGLNYWESHRDREEAAAQAAQAAKAAQVRPASVFLMRGEADQDGERVMLEPTKAEQVVQTQRYLFPKPVLDHPREIGAGRLQIDLSWFDSGLKKELKAARKAGARLPEGEAMLPVGVVTSYVENGETRTDSSIYRVGYVASGGLLGAVKLKLLGVSLVRRGATGDLQAAVDGQWRAQMPAVKPAG